MQRSPCYQCRGNYRWLVAHQNWFSENSFWGKAKKKTLFHKQMIQFPLNACSRIMVKRFSEQYACLSTGWASVVWFPFFSLSLSFFSSVSIIELVSIRFHKILPILNQIREQWNQPLHLTARESCITKTKRNWISSFVAYWFFFLNLQFEWVFVCVCEWESECPRHLQNLHSKCYNMDQYFTQ